MVILRANLQDQGGEKELMSITIGDLVLYDIEELAMKLGVRSRYVRKLLADGDLQGKRFAKKWYVSEKSLTEYFSQVDPPMKRSAPN